jgi:hypothetical protein
MISDGWVGERSDPLDALSHGFSRLFGGCFARPLSALRQHVFPLRQTRMNIHVRVAPFPPDFWMQKVARPFLVLRIRLQPRGFP